MKLEELLLSFADDNKIDSQIGKMETTDILTVAFLRAALTLSDSHVYFYNVIAKLQNPRKDWGHQHQLNTALYLNLQFCKPLD